MYSLILSVLAIALQAVSLYCLLNYVPAWTKSAPDHSRQVAASLSTLEGGYYRYAAANGGSVPLPTVAPDGGLSQFQAPVEHIPFLPKAPEGFLWKYGQAVDHFVCLDAIDDAHPMDESLFRGVKRLKQLLPAEQLIISAGAHTCGSGTDVSTQSFTFPAQLSVTYFLRYAPAAGPSTDVLPCSRTHCLIAEAL